MGSILQVRQQVRQLNIRFIQHHRRCTRFLGRLNARLANGDIGLPPLQARLRNRRCLLQSADAISDQLGVVKLHAIGGLMLDAIP